MAITRRSHQFGGVAQFNYMKKVSPSSTSTSKERRTHKDTPITHKGKSATHKGIGISSSLIDSLREEYSNLAERYHLKGLEHESIVFSRIAREFENLMKNFEEQ